MVDRLELILKTKGLSPAQLADAIGVKRSGVYHIMNGRNKPGLDFITKLLGHFPEVNPDWLILGKGSMVKKQELSMVEESLINNPQMPISQQNNSSDQEKLPDPKRISYSGKKVPKKTDKEVVRIVVFYNDNTFREYTPA